MSQFLVLMVFIVPLSVLMSYMWIKSGSETQTCSILSQYFTPNIY